jgi:thymidylate synthase
LNQKTVSDIRKEFIDKYEGCEFSEDGNIEIVNASFVANEDYIFGKPNKDYIQKELIWYLSQELNIKGLGPDIPKIWQQVAGKNGVINSNYGWCIFSDKNGNQYEHCVLELSINPASRRAVMIYNRPSMHIDCNNNGMNDFICTNSAQVMIRGGKLQYIVQMRSNDAIYGYRNDIAWHRWVHITMADRLNVKLGFMYWNAASLHIYPRHFDIIK